MKKAFKVILIVQLQLIFIAMIYLILSQRQVHQKLYNTNKFIFEVLKNDKLIDIVRITENDIAIQNESAKINIVVYSRFDCPHCSDFVKDHLNNLIEDYVETNKVKIVFRFLTHHSKPNSLYATKGAYFAASQGFLQAYLNRIAKEENLDKNTVLSAMPENLKSSFSDFTNNKDMEANILNNAKNYRQFGVKQTPTLFIDQFKLVGNVNYSRLKTTIDQALEL